MKRVVQPRGQDWLKKENVTCCMQMILNFNDANDCFILEAYSVSSRVFGINPSVQPYFLFVFGIFSEFLELISQSIIVGYFRSGLRAQYL